MTKHISLDLRRVPSTQLKRLNNQYAYINRQTMQTPEEYQQVNSMQSTDLKVTLKEHPTQWKEKNARIMDIGCGDGSVTMGIWKKHIPDNFMTILGTDKSQKCVDFAKDNYESERVTFTRLDIEEDLPNELKGLFDHVISNYALHWVHRQEKAFTNIYNMLAEGGKCLLIFLGYVDIYENFRRLSLTSKWRADLKDCETKFMSPYHDSQDTENEIHVLMKKIGFRDIDIKVQNKTFDFVRGVEEFKSLMKCLNPFEGLKDKWEEFMDDYLKLAPGAASTTYQLLVVSGTK